MDHRNPATNNPPRLLTSVLLDVSVQVRPRSDERFDLHGQILPLIGIDPELCSIELVSEDGEKWMAESDDLGVFEIQDLSSRMAYRLIVTGQGFEVTMPERIWCDLDACV